MKTFLSFIFAGLATIAFGAPFGSLVEPYQVTSRAHKTMYLIDKIAREEPVFLCVDGRLDKYTLSKEQINSALNSWFQYAYQSIVRAKRQREFKDLLPILSKGAQIRLQNCENNPFFQKKFAAQIKNGSGAPDYAYASTREDLRLILLDEEDISDGRSYFDEGAVNGTSYIVWNANDRRGSDGLDVLRHELGHALSLSDQYQESRLNSAAAYGTSDTMPAMMNDGKKFTCDDADGLIFTLDCIAQKNTARGGAEGWRSFCPQRAGRNYAYCKTKYREDLLWVSDNTVRYARYDSQGNLTVHKEWNRLTDSRLFTLYPEGLPPLPAQLQTVYKGKYVSYKTDGRTEYLFSTRPEKDGDAFALQPGQTLVVRANPNYSVALIKDKKNLIIPLGKNEISFSQNADKTMTAQTNAPVSNRGMNVNFIYTPQVRFEYYQQERKMIIFMFPKDAARFYVFFDKRTDEAPSFASAAAAMPKSADEYPVLDSHSAAKEAKDLILRAKPIYLIYHSLDSGRSNGDYCVDEAKTLPADFLFADELARTAWDLHTRYRRFFEGTIQNWMPGSLSEGFTSTSTGSKTAKTQARQQITQDVAARLQRGK